MNSASQTRRLLHVVRVLVAHGVAHAIARYGAHLPWLVRRSSLASLAAPQRFRRLFEDLGGSFIKFGQMLALQPDIVSLEYCDELFNLLEHDGYLERRADGGRAFCSRLLRDWWRARHGEFYLPADQRGAR